MRTRRAQKLGSTGERSPARRNAPLVLDKYHGACSLTFATHNTMASWIRHGNQRAVCDASGSRLNLVCGTIFTGTRPTRSAMIQHAPSARAYLK